MRPNNFIGFAPADWVLAFLAGSLLLSVWVWKPGVQRAFERLAAKPRTCMVILFAAPIILRLLLLPQHPVPTPDVYDEFSHLLMADTLLHGRLANPPHAMHRFFETFFVLQQPTYSSIYAPGVGLSLVIGRLLSGTAWAGVLLFSGLFCATCHWMLRGWVAPTWALLGGLLAVMEFGPLCQWMNSYWGGYFAATGGCLVFGALPRMHLQDRRRDAALLGCGFGMHMITREFETLLLLIAVVLFLVPALVSQRRQMLHTLAFAVIAAIPFLALIAFQNRAVTHSWTVIPEQLSQYQYGVPSSLTLQENVTPHVPLTPQQQLDYKAQVLAHGPGRETVVNFLLRLEYRVRFYRFFFLPPLYLALLGFVSALRDKRMLWVAVTLTVFALGADLFPYFMTHYIAAATCLFVLVSIVGLREISRLKVRGSAVGFEIARVLIVLCLAESGGWYLLHLFESEDFLGVLQYETWDAINHANPKRRIAISHQLQGTDGSLLIFVRYSPHHVYQDEWVWNNADIDSSRVVYARDLGPQEDAKLIAYYPKRKVMLLEPDDYVPRLSSYQAIPQ